MHLTEDYDKTMVGKRFLALSASRKMIPGEGKYGGMEASDLKRLKELEAENRKLKQMYAESELHNRVLKEVIEKKL